MGRCHSWGPDGLPGYKHTNLVTNSVRNSLCINPLRGGGKLSLEAKGCQLAVLNRTPQCDPGCICDCRAPLLLASLPLSLLRLPFLGPGLLLPCLPLGSLALRAQNEVVAQRLERDGLEPCFAETRERFVRSMGVVLWRADGAIDGAIPIDDQKRSLRLEQPGHPPQRRVSQFMQDVHGQN